MLRSKSATNYEESDSGGDTAAESVASGAGAGEVTGDVEGKVEEEGEGEGELPHILILIFVGRAVLFSCMIKFRKEKTIS